MANNKRAGSNAERLYARYFRDLGFKYCKTSREESKLLDSSGIDLTNLPFNIQLKSGKQKNLNYSKELFDIDNKIQLNLSPDNPYNGKPVVLIHRKNVGKGFKRTKYNDIAIMTVETMSELLLIYDKYKKNESNKQ